MSLINFYEDDAKKTTSPVKHIWPHVPKGLLALKSETRELLISTGISADLRLVNTPEFICHVQTQPSIIEISTGCIQMLWASCYLNFLYYDKWFRSGGLDNQTTIDPEQDPELKTAVELFEWSFNAVFNKSIFTDWPDTLPSPPEEAKKGSWEFFADDLSLEALSFLILHELAHVHFGHQPTQESHKSIEQEKEADAQAVDWFIGDITNPYNGHRVKRSIAIASTLMMLCAHSYYTGKWGGKSHPPTWERLREVVFQISNDKRHPVFAFLTEMIKQYRRMSGRLTNDEVSFDSFLEAFESFILSMKAEHDAQQQATP